MRKTQKYQKPILVILAAGMASRYGSAKQVESWTIWRKNYRLFYI